MGHSFSCRTDILFIITTVMDEKLLNMDVKHLLKKKKKIFRASQAWWRKVDMTLLLTVG